MLQSKTSGKNSETKEARGFIKEMKQSAEGQYFRVQTQNTQSFYLVEKNRHCERFEANFEGFTALVENREEKCRALTFRQT